MSGGWRTVRVFLSSTFRDMHAERDHLVKMTFPRLRQWCEERRLHFVDLDLRWGSAARRPRTGWPWHLLQSGLAQVEAALLVGGDALQRLEVSFDAVNQRGEAFIWMASTQHDNPGIVPQNAPATHDTHDVVEGVLNIFVKRANEYRAVNQQQREEAVRLLQRCQWKPYAEID